MHQLFLLSCVLILTVLSTEISAVPFFIPAVTDQTLPPDASPMATPGFDVHIGRCPPINKNCDNLPVRYYCASDLACFSWQKCCLSSCSYVCTSSKGWWETRETGDITNQNDGDNTISSANDKEDREKLHTEMGQAETGPKQ